MFKIYNLWIWTIFRLRDFWYHPKWCLIQVKNPGFWQMKFHCIFSLARHFCCRNFKVNSHVLLVNFAHLLANSPLFSFFVVSEPPDSFLWLQRQISGSVPCNKRWRLWRSAADFQIFHSHFWWETRHLTSLFTQKNNPSRHPGCWEQPWRWVSNLDTASKTWIEMNRTDMYIYI